VTWLVEDGDTRSASCGTGCYVAQNLLGYTAMFLIELIQLRTRQYIPEDSELHTRRHENFKSHRMLCVLRKIFHHEM
jgi:hypothetical protein